LRIFKIQTLSKKGVLSNPQTIGVYTSKYENLKNIPSRPDERQKNALISLEKKIKFALKSLNKEGLKKQQEVPHMALNLKKIGNDSMVIKYILKIRIF